MTSLFGGSRRGGGRGVGLGEVQPQGNRAELKELCGGRMLLRVSPIRGTSVVLRALAGETVHLRPALPRCPFSLGSQRRGPMYSHGVMGRASLGFGGWIFPFSPEGHAKRTCEHNTMLRGLHIISTPRDAPRTKFQLQKTCSFFLQTSFLCLTLTRINEDSLISSKRNLREAFD